MEKQNVEKQENKKGKMTAKKDWLIVQNSDRYDIKKGDDVSKIPKKFLVALKTENVI